MGARTRTAAWLCALALAASCGAGAQAAEAGAGALTPAGAAELAAPGATAQGGGRTLVLARGLPEGQAADVAQAADEAAAAARALSGRAVTRTWESPSGGTRARAELAGQVSVRLEAADGTWAAAAFDAQEPPSDGASGEALMSAAAGLRAADGTSSGTCAASVLYLTNDGLALFDDWDELMAYTDEQLLAGNLAGAAWRDVPVPSEGEHAWPDGVSVNSAGEVTMPDGRVLRAGDRPAPSGAQQGGAAGGDAGPQAPSGTADGTAATGGAQQGAAEPSGEEASGTGEPSGDTAQPGPDAPAAPGEPAQAEPRWVEDSPAWDEPTYEEKWVEDAPAWDEPTYEDRWVVDVPESTEQVWVCTMHYTNDGLFQTSDWDELMAYTDEQLLAGNLAGGAWRDEEVYETVTTPEQGHWESVQTGTVHHEATGHTERVQTGTTHHDATGHWE